VYSNPERALQGLVNAEAKQPINHFCIVGYRSSEGDTSVWFGGGKAPA
jgi:hypothetical protein